MAEEGPEEVEEEVTVEVASFSMESNVDYAAMTVTQLRGVAKENGIAGYSTMNKAELLEALGC